MLNSKFQFRLDEEEYNLALRWDSNWKTAKRRVLIFLQFVPAECLKERDIMGAPIVRDTIINCIQYAQSECARHKKPVGNVAYAVVNFNARRHLHLKGTARHDAELEFTARAQKLIKRLNPTDVFVSGEYAAGHLLPTVNHLPYKMGWVHDIGGVRYSATYDLDALLQKKGSLANLLGLWVQHLSHLLMGQHPYSLRGLVPTPRYIGTIKEFKQLMKKLEDAKLISVDSETRNLSVLSNAIYTIQFATDLDPKVGYVLPIDHPSTPYSKKEVKYIKQELRQFFGRSTNLKELVTFNGMYDLRVIRQELKIPIIWHDVWEISAGEHLLEENLDRVRGVSVPQGGLLATLCRYDNSFYLDAKFSKQDRNTTGNLPPNDPEFLKYGAMDAVCLLYLRAQQLNRAGNLTIDGKNYKAIFKRHMLKMMGPTAHQLSHLQQDGSKLDRKYLRSLAASDSPFRQEMQKAVTRLRGSPAVVEANKILMSQSGVKAKSLFGGVQWMWNPSKPAHRIILFSEVKGLEITEVTKTGAPKIDKHFLATHKKDPDVALYAEWQKMEKAYGTYVKGWTRILRSNIDAMKDDFIRAGYSFFGVATGRLNSKEPNFQQIPSRGAVAAIIKRALIAEYGMISVRFDFSAHEVRMWSVVSGDKVLAGSFRQGQKLRQQWIQNPSSDIKNELKTKGDIHIQNCYRFFRRWVEKADPLRNAVKATIFGLLYGKSAKSLGEDVRSSDLQEIEAKISKLEAERAKLQAQL